MRFEKNTSSILFLSFQGIRLLKALIPWIFWVSEKVYEPIFKEKLREFLKGIKELIWIKWHADETVRFPCNMQNLQFMTHKIVQCSEYWGLRVNTSETKLILFAKWSKCQSINGIKVEQVKTINYLEIIIDHQSYKKQDSRSRIEQARRTFISMKKFFAT